ncbi:MAG: hypothetical protein Q7J75_06150, partial [Rhodoferax sp.]|nr:hypothetical protein [Rhodoferax sp.]
MKMTLSMATSAELNNSMKRAPTSRFAHRSGVALALALLGLTAPAWAQGAAPAKGSSAHISAATQGIDGKFMRANEAKTADWPSYGLDYAETRFSKLNQVNASNV